MTRRVHTHKKNLIMADRTPSMRIQRGICSPSFVSRKTADCFKSGFSCLLCVSTMSNLFVKVFPSYGSSFSLLRLYSSKPKPYIYRKPAKFYTPHDVFRQKLGLTKWLNQTKELQEYSDYSFQDGRPTPVTPGQLKKIQRQQALAAAAVLHLKEIKFILDRETHNKQSASTERQQIIEGKLKPKGDKLLKKNA